MHVSLNVFGMRPNQTDFIQLVAIKVEKKIKNKFMNATKFNILLTFQQHIPLSLSEWQRDGCEQKLM